MIESGKEILKTRRDIIKAYKKSRGEKTLNLIDLKEDEEDEEDEEDKEDEEYEEDGEDEDKKLPAWVGVSRKRFNEIKNEIDKTVNNKLKTKVPGKIITITPIKELVNRINKLDSNKENIDKKSYDMYNIVKEYSIDLVNAINSKGLTLSRIKLNHLIGEIFNDKKQESQKLDIATGGEDIPESKKQAKKRPGQIDDEVKERTKKSQQEAVKRMRTSSNNNDKPEEEQSSSTGHGLKIITSSQLLTRLPILLAQKQAGNNSQKLNNEIRQIVYSLYNSKNYQKHSIII